MKKKIYVLLTIVMLVYLFGVTALNILRYGSVMSWNISILSLAILIPLYLGFKDKKFEKKMILIMSFYMLLITAFLIAVLPKYSYLEAYESFDHQVDTLRKHVGESTFLYNGSYYVKTENGAYSFHIHTGDIQGVEDDFN